MIVATGDGPRFVYDDTIPSDYVIVPNSKGWHIIRGEDYFFVPYHRLHEIYQGAAEAVWMKYMAKEPNK
jgi:hypothetical protein